MNSQIVSEWHKTMLDPRKTVIYDTVVHKLASFCDRIAFDCEVRHEELAMIHEMVRLDHPELFYVGRGFGIRHSPTLGGYKLTMLPTYHLTPSEAKETYAQLLTRALTLGKTETQAPLSIARSVHDKLIGCGTYRVDRRWETHEAVGVLLDGYGVCEGFAKAYKLVCESRGLPCVVMSGEFHSRNNSGNLQTGHAWNAVRIADDLNQGRGWSMVDVSSDACMSDKGVVRHDYFGLTDNESRGLYLARGRSRILCDVPADFYSREALLARNAHEFIRIAKRRLAAGYRGFEVRLPRLSGSTPLELGSHMVNLLSANLADCGVDCRTIDWTVNEERMVAAFSLVI